MLRTRRISSYFVWLMFILLLPPGCVALTGETAGENIDDAVITTEIKGKLAGEKLLHATKVGVKTERGVVYLTGSVETAAERSQVVQIAKQVKGVREVVDHLEVRP